MPGIIVPDAEVIMVAWARQNAEINALIAGRVATTKPDTHAYPFLRVFRIPGFTRDRHMPIDHAYIQWDAYGRRKEGGPDYRSASQLARTLVAEAAEAEDILVPTLGVILGFDIIDGPARQPEPEQEWARFRVDMEAMIRGI